MSAFAQPATIAMDMNHVSSRIVERSVAVSNQSTGMAVDLDYVALCIAEQVVRIKLSTARHLRSSDRASDASPLLTQPLYALATTLGIKDTVVDMVSDALAGAV
jgi:hypothetical protein